MEVTLNWHLLIGAVLAYYGTLIFYRLFLHPLARFPGPRLAAISRWYEAYYDVYMGGKYTIKIAELHKSYGPIIRISPHELHVIDPAFYETLYRTDGRWHKYAWTYDAAGAKSSTLFCSDHDAHKARRRAIAPCFSKPNVMARQNLLSNSIDKLCKRLSKLTGTTINLGAAMSAFTQDIANEFVIGKSYNDIELEDLNHPIAPPGPGMFWRVTKHVRWFGPTIKAIPINWVAKVADAKMKAFLLRLQQGEKDTKYILTAAESPSPDNQVRSTMVYAILHSDLPSTDKSFERVFEEVATVTGAGFETTANAMRLILYHVYSNDKILQRLRHELQSQHSKLTLKDLEQLPYLTAVLMEGMRLSPAVATRAARITDKDLFYKGWRIPAGSPVGMTAILMHTNEELYPEPMQFIPDRWMQSLDRKGSLPGYAPFSRGTRICLGMHLAWAEMYMLLAALVENFDFTMKDATASDFELEKDDFGIGTKAGHNLMAHVALNQS